MKIILSEDELTTKFIHKDGSETSIKTNLSGQYDSMLSLIEQDNDKYSIVISCSKGCPLACQFCHLTQKGVSHARLTTDQILSNLKEAVDYIALTNPSIKNKYIKLCWMGMGDPFLELPLVIEVTEQLLSWVFENKYAKGLDGIDISTVFPKRKFNLKGILSVLVDKLNIYEATRNPKHLGNSLVRIFYSLHFANQATRDFMIPCSKMNHVGLAGLKGWCEELDVDLVIHYMFFEGVNDSKAEVDKLIKLLETTQTKKYELRILRYNPDKQNSILEESSHLTAIIGYLKTRNVNVKVQHSSGKDVMAACGQFIG